jgi:3-phenylpropionate/trans-cinnamate dioxygenase ferredoxin reductase subunit
MSEPGVVIVGSGQGGFQAAASLRDEGYTGMITVVGEEAGLPYQRPPLSKAYLAGKATDEQLWLRTESFYVGRDIVLKSGASVRCIDRAARELLLDGGERLAYSQLVLATGARPRTLRVPGAGLAGVLPLRSRFDAQRMLERLRAASSVVVVGAGFIGLEVAVVASNMGLRTQVLECAGRALQRVVSADVAGFLTDALASRGVRFQFNTGIEAIKGEASGVTAVRTTAGEYIDADLVVVGVGVEPNTALAMDAGLAVDNGIVVDGFLRTADPVISAIGDCARYPAPYSDAPVRLESVQNAVDQARCVAARLVGRAEPYDKVPWFWSDQGEWRLQIAGVAVEGDSAVLRGDPATGKFSVFRFRGDRLVAVESINHTADHLAARKLLAVRAGVTPAQAADTGLNLAALAA